VDDAEINRGARGMPFISLISESDTIGSRESSSDAHTNMLAGPRRRKTHKPAAAKGTLPLKPVVGDA